VTSERNQKEEVVLNVYLFFQDMW